MIAEQAWRITEAFGVVDKLHPHGHRGVDFAANLNTPLPSISDGYVTKVAAQAHGFGRYIKVHNYDGYDVIYGHLSKQAVHIGDQIKAGQIIGYTGNTGDSTGPHLHLQVMRDQLPIDPIRYMGDHLAPWYDVNAHGMTFMDGLKDWWQAGMLHFATDTLEWMIPTIAAFGILWWMFPFAPKRDKGVKLAGFMVFVYLFYALIKAVYIDGAD